MASHLSFLPLFLLLGLQHRTPALPSKGILGVHCPCFVHEGCWDPSSSAMLEDPGHPEDPGPVPAVPAFSRGPCLCVSQKHGRGHLALCVSSPLGREPGVGPTDPSQREDAGECLLPLAPVKPFPAKLLTVCSQFEVGAGGMPGSPAWGGDQPVSCGCQLSCSGASQHSSTWGSVVPGTFLTVYLRQKGCTVHHGHNSLAVHIWL